MKIKTFTFEARYSGDGGGRVDIVNAPDRDTAIRLAACAIIADNGWGDDRLEGYKSLAAFYEDEMTILHEWEGVEGTMCPSCSAQDTRDTGHDFAGSAGPVHQCNTCGYQWVPLGKSLAWETEAELNFKNILAEIDKFEAEHFGKDDAE